MKQLILVTTALLFLPASGLAQSTRTGACGDVSSWSDEDWNVIVAPLFLDRAPDDVRIRAEFGIAEQPEGTKAQTVTDERVCRDLQRVLREALRRSDATTLRLNDVVPTYVQVGRYYYVALTLKNSLPPDVQARMPSVIIDGNTMSFVRMVF